MKAHLAVRMRLCIAHRLRLQRDMVQQRDIVTGCHKVEEELDVSKDMPCEPSMYGSGVDEHTSQYLEGTPVLF